MTEYIEREALLELYDMGKELEEYAEVLSVPISVIRQNIKDMPAADVAPVVHGLWRYRSKGRCGVELFCTACDSAPGSPQRKTKCCPNCGARMDGE